MKKLSAALVFATFVFIQVIAPGHALAGGVIKYHVKVKNDMSDPPQVFTCTVNLYDGALNVKTETIAQGETKTLTI
jgi:hypothetical protein